MGDQSQIARQATVAHRLERIDRWGKIMTVVVALYGVLLAATYFYQYWTESAQQLWG
jgi:hypothetical protein